MALSVSCGVSPFVTAMIIPTGIGAAIGGFAGDATPCMNLLASASDILITHPNVANAAVFQRLPDNALYVEGYVLDQWMLGRQALRPVRKNRIGVVFDAGIPDDMLTLHINTLHAVKSVYGVDIVSYTRTETPVETGCELQSSGCSSGYLRNPETILSACRTLLSEGADAIALCVLLPEIEKDGEALEAEYRAGQGVDPIGGLEGILSHLVVSELGVPCAHAPVFPWEKALPVTDEILDPRAAAEFIAPTFLPCVLTGLHRAPHACPIAEARPTDLTVNALSALIVPADTLGGLPVLAALGRNIPVIAVKANRTVLDMDINALHGVPPDRRRLVRVAHSYEEATGMLQAMRLGLTLDIRRIEEVSPSALSSASGSRFPLRATL